MPDGNEAACRRLSAGFQASAQTSAQTSVQVPVQAPAQASNNRLSWGEGLSLHDRARLDPGPGDPFRRVKASRRFRCPHCGGRDSLGLEQRQARDCLVQRHRCQDCRQAIPRHLAERWLGLTFREAQAQWRDLRRGWDGGKGAASDPTSKPAFQPDSCALLRLLRRQAAQQVSAPPKA